MVISLLKMALEHGVETLSSVSRKRKPVMCLREKIYWLDKPHSDKSYTAIDHEFKANESKNI